MSRPRSFLPALLVLLLTGCASSVRIEPPPPQTGPQAPVTEAGQASFFFPIRIPLAEVERILDQTLPRRMADERSEELTDALKDDFVRYDLERGPVEAGFSDGWITFSVPIHGTVTAGGRIPMPVGKGVPVRETVKLDGRIVGTALPALGPDWRPEPAPQARLELGRAELRLLRTFTLSVRNLLQEKLNPVLNQELARASERLAADLGLREKAQEAWSSLHFARRALVGQDLWLRFQPSDLTVARVREKDGALLSGIGISGQMDLVLGRTASPPSVTPLPPPRRVEAREDGRFEMEIPFVAPAADLSALADRSLKGFRWRQGKSPKSREMVVTAARLDAAGERLLLAVDFRSGGEGSRAAEGVLYLRGRPVFDPRTRTLSVQDLEYDLATHSLLLRFASWMNRQDILTSLARRTRLDLTSILERAQQEARQVIRDLIPRGLEGDIRLDPVSLVGVSVADGYVLARWRVTGSAVLEVGRE